jgi:hypothetical protein
MEKYQRYLVFGLNGMLGLLIYNFFFLNKYVTSTAIVCTFLGLLIFIFQLTWTINHPFKILAKVSNRASIIYLTFLALLVSLMDFLLPLVVVKFNMIYTNQLPFEYKATIIIFIVISYICNIKNILHFTNYIDRELDTIL